MTWSKTEAVRRLFTALLLFVAAWPATGAVDGPIPLQRPGFLSATAAAVGGELQIGGVVVAPPGSIVVVIGVPGKEDVELDIEAGGGFDGAFPIAPGTTGTVEVRLILPNGTLVDSIELQFD